jgi:hypothetical protein
MEVEIQEDLFDSRGDAAMHPRSAEIREFLFFSFYSPCFLILLGKTRDTEAGFWKDTPHTRKFRWTTAADRSFSISTPDFLVSWMMMFTALMTDIPQDATSFFSFLLLRISSTFRLDVGRTPLLGKRERRDDGHRNKGIFAQTRSIRDRSRLVVANSTLI